MDFCKHTNALAALVIRIFTSFCTLPLLVMLLPRYVKSCTISIEPLSSSTSMLALAVSCLPMIIPFVFWMLTVRPYSDAAWTNSDLTHSKAARVLAYTASSVNCDSVTLTSLILDVTVCVWVRVSAISGWHTHTHTNQFYSISLSVRLSGIHSCVDYYHSCVNLIC